MPFALVADLAKRVIQVHAVDVRGRVVTGNALRREEFLPWCARLPSGSMVGSPGSGNYFCSRRLCRCLLTFRNARFE